MKTAILGNGPSRTLYNEDEEFDFVVGCNIPWTKVDATVICDIEIVNLLRNDFTLIQVPVIISTVVYEKMKEFRIVDSFTILNVFKPRDWHNAAHYAVDYLMNKNADEIQIYGCDSIFEDDITSKTDTAVEKTMDSERFIRQWRKVWDKKFESDIKFLIHKNNLNNTLV